MDNLEFLAHRMKQKSPALLLGAGFSIGALNGTSEPLVMGDQLKKKLYKHFYEDSKFSGHTKEDLEAIKEYNLKEICGVLRSENRIEERNEFLTNFFTNCYPTKNDNFHNLIVDYKWKEIFTLNIDDLVENIYTEFKIPLDVWSLGNNGYTNRNNHMKLIKLHGCVNNSQDGYVFDDEEYTEYTAKQNSLYKEFSRSFLQNDMIILGTEFSEYDLKVAIQMYSEAGYKGDGNNYFFVTPALKDIALKNKIKSNPSFKWIQMTTKDFLEFVSENITIPEGERNTLKEKGVIFIDEIPRKTNYISQLYTGIESEYNDIFLEWDIAYPKLKTEVKDFIDQEKSGILAIYGNSYVGKSSVAKRALINFMNQDFHAIEVKRVDAHIKNALRTYFSQFPNDSKIAILVEDSSYQYTHLIHLLKDVGTNISQLVIISTDIEENHETKSYILQKSKLTKMIKVSETLDSDYLNNIFNKLYEKNRLGNFIDLIPPKADLSNFKSQRTIKNEMRKMNDIVEVLYYSSEGRAFQDYYQDWLKEHYHKNYTYYLYAMSALGELGIINVPNAIMPRLVPEKRKDFSLNEFVERFPGIITVSRGRTKLRRQRILHPVMVDYDTKIIFDLLHEVSLYSVEMFKEGVDNEYSEIFQKALKVRKIIKKSLLPKNELYELLKSIENKCEKLSYFWVQYGIVCQIMSKFEEANNHFLYAKNIRPDSYQVKHALSKNWMERGLYELERKVRSAEQSFEFGKLEMQSLIKSDYHKDAFLYSVHAYVNSILKFYSLKKELVPEDELKFIEESLQAGIKDNRQDIKFKAIVSKFIEYCKKNKINFNSELYTIEKINSYNLDEEIIYDESNIVNEANNN